MTRTVSIELEPDPVPVVKIIGAQFKRAMRDPKFSRRIHNFRGCFALAPPRDPQTLTIHIDNGKVYIHHGVDARAKVTVRVDFNRIGEPGYTPEVEGVLRHPLLVYRIAKLLDFPKPTWTDAAKRFWEHTFAMPRMPSSIKVFNEDDGQEIVLGDGEPRVEIHGSANALANLFSGSAILVQEVTTKRLRILGSLKDIAVLSGVTQQLMLGEIDCEY